MPRPPEEHAENLDLRHEDFNDNDFLYDVYSVMRERTAFSHTEVPFLSATPGGAGSRHGMRIATGSCRTGSTSRAIRHRRRPNNSQATS